MRTVTALLLLFLPASACSQDSESPDARRASLRALYEQSGAAELQRQMSRQSRVVGRATAENAGRAFPNAAGPALAASIRSRDQARRAGAVPMPPDLRRALAPHFEATTLEKVRWNTAGPRVSLGTLLAGWYYSEGAVTLGDTIVFSDARMAGQLLLWAHELTHVEQFEELGVDGFASLYTTDWAELERRARENAVDVVREVRQADQDAA